MHPFAAPLPAVPLLEPPQLDIFGMLGGSGGSSGALVFLGLCKPYAIISRYNTIHYNTIHYNTIQYNTNTIHAMQRNAMQCNTIQYGIIRYIIHAYQCDIDAISLQRQAR